MGGVVYVAFGKKARTEAVKSITSLRRLNNPSVAVVSDKPLPGAEHIPFDDPGPGARWAKLNIDKLAPWDKVAYLDADTRPSGDISTGFDILDDGWDMAITPSDNQGDDLLWHVGEAERWATLGILGYTPIQLQAGAMWFKKSARTSRFFKLWRNEWHIWKDQDQAAFLRALRLQPLKIWLLGRPWNGGAVIAHHFGRAK